MKRTKLLSLLVTAGMLLSCMIVPAAAAGDKTAVLKIGSPYCALDGQVSTIDPDNPSVAPVIINTRTMLPIRMLIEHFGGSVAWDGASRQVTCTLNGRTVVLTIGSASAQVNGVETTLDVPATIRDTRTLVPVRFVSENLSLHVGWEPQNRLVVVSQGELSADSSQLLAMQEVRALLSKLNEPKPVALESKSYQLNSGTVSANVVKVDLNHPSVRVEARHVDGTLNHTAAFSGIVNSGAEVVINANFFNSYDKVQDPIGSLICQGKPIYINSGVPSLGFTSDNRTFWGDPSIFTRVQSDDGNTWAAYTVNTLEQSSDVSVLYTPARGNSVPITANGFAMTISGGKMTGYAPVSAGSTAAIPADGCLLYMGTGFTATEYFRTPSVGSAVTVTPYQRVEDSEGFVLDGVTQLISGAPRLVKDGKIFTGLIPGFEESRFTSASTPRTAIGTTVDGRLILVTVKAATIQQMRELMLTLGCEDATNLDGGASTAMYYQGKIIASPGRALTSTLHIFVD